MLKDNIENLKKYICLDDDLSLFSIEKCITSDSSSAAFEVDKNKTHLFCVLKGEADFATSWRENENNREVLAACKAREGEFVLYLPGEPYAYHLLDAARVGMWSNQ